MFFGEASSPPQVHHTQLKHHHARATAEVSRASNRRWKSLIRKHDVWITVHGNPLESMSKSFNTHVHWCLFCRCFRLLWYVLVGWVAGWCSVGSMLDSDLVRYYRNDPKRRFLCGKTKIDQDSISSGYSCDYPKNISLFARSIRNSWTQSVAFSTNTMFRCCSESHQPAFMARLHVTQPG